jgi:hypothetical protein
MLFVNEAHLTPALLHHIRSSDTTPLLWMATIQVLESKDWLAILTDILARRKISGHTNCVFIP